MSEEIKTTESGECREEKLPIDAKLLSDAVISLNISRRSVSLYPGDHPITRESIKNAFEYLKKLFELRSSITLGIAKDVLMIDDYVLDRKNPVFREFAHGLHDKGIAALTFISGLTLEELLHFHEIILAREGPSGQAMVELAEKKGIKYIRFSLLDLSKFGFMQDSIREDGTDKYILENYIFGLLEGKLLGDDADVVLLNIPPEDMAFYINKKMGDTEEVDNESYDRVITAYLKKKEHTGIRPDMLSRFMSLVENLSPELKKQFLSRAFTQPSMETGDVEHVMGRMTTHDLEKITNLFREHSALIPESIRNLLDKLKASKVSEDYFDVLSGRKAVIDDVEIDDNILSLFKEDHFTAFVTDDYKQDLLKMLKGARTINSQLMEELHKQCEEGILDRRLSELTLELLESDSISREDYLALLTPILENADNFLETGRFSEISEIYNAIYSQALAGRFREEASGMLEFFFRSQEFVEKFTKAVRIWGRYDREGVLRLVNVQKLYLLDSLFEALAGEPDPSVRKFILQLLSDMGTDTVTAAVKRLNDKNWYTVRNMLYLIREAGGSKYVGHVRKFAKDSNKKICMEAVKTLLHFRTSDASSYIKFYLRSDDPELREQAVRLSGLYRCREAATCLLELLRKKDIFGTESYFRVAVVKALGQIGDTRAIEDFMKIYRSKTIIYRAALEEIKMEIFRNLENFPPDRISQLLELGLSSTNDEIRSISGKLLKIGEENASEKNI